MIAPILGESFVKSADLDNGKNGLASIGGANINTNGGLIDSGMNLANSLQLSPMLVKKSMDDMFDSAIGQKVYAVDEPISRDKNGNIIGGKTRYTTDANAGGTEVIGARSGGLYGNYAQSQANDIEKEQREYRLNQQKINNVEKERQTIEMYQKNVKSTLTAIKDSANTKANEQMKAIFGNNAGNFDDIKRTMDNYFMNTIGGYDLTEAVNSYDNGASNSAVYMTMRKKGLTDTQISQIMSMARQVHNTDIDRKNTEAGILSREDTMRLANDVKMRLGQQGYNNDESTYLAKLGVSLGSKGIENESIMLESAHSANRLQKSKLSAQAIALENQMNETRRHNQSIESIQRSKNQSIESIQRSKNQLLGQQNNSSIDNTQTIDTQDIENDEVINTDNKVVNVENGADYGESENKSVVTFADGEKILINKKMFMIDSQQRLQILDGYEDIKYMIQLSNERLNKKDAIIEYADIMNRMYELDKEMNKHHPTSEEYAKIKEKFSDEKNRLLKFNRIRKHQEMININEFMNRKNSLKPQQSKVDDSKMIELIRQRDKASVNEKEKNIYDNQLEQNGIKDKDVIRAKKDFDIISNRNKLAKTYGGFGDMKIPEDSPQAKFLTALSFLNSEGSPLEEFLSVKGYDNINQKEVTFGEVIIKKGLDVVLDGKLSNEEKAKALEHILENIKRDKDSKNGIHSKILIGDKALNIDSLLQFLQLAVKYENKIDLNFISKLREEAKKLK